MLKKKPIYLSTWNAFSITLERYLISGVDAMCLFFRKISAVVFILAVPFFIVTQGFSQTASIESKQKIQKKPAVADSRWASPSTQGMRVAPPAPVHSIAEWEESEGVMILWMNDDLINRLQEVIKVYIPVDNQSEKDSWISYLNTHGIPLTNIEFIFITTDTVWTRDYGPWFIWDGNQDLGICDYSCDNHGAVYGPNDSAFPYHFASLFGINYYDSGIENVGGNWYPNGYETAFSSNRIYTMNPWETVLQ
ncbi:MAG: agmatine deiminase family protein, partial [Planctomycetota bacterium]